MRLVSVYFREVNNQTISEETLKHFLINLNYELVAHFND